MFFGEYLHQMDAKNRIRIPSKFKTEFTGSYCFCKAPGKAISIYPYDAMVKQMEKLSKIPPYDPIPYKMARLVLGSIFQPEEDPQGRVVIPESLRSWAELDKDIVTVGVGDHLDIMSKKNKDSDDADTDFDEMMKVIATAAEKYGI